MPGFDKNVLPPLEIACLLVVTAIPAIYSMTKPQEIKETMQNHPVYAAGMAGVWLGSMA